MSTDLQIALAMAKIENQKLPRDKRKNKKELLVSVGYATKTAEKQPSRELESKGVKDAIRAMGLTEELITDALVNDIKEKAKNRLGEMRLGAEILGMNDNENKGGKILIINVSGETSKRNTLPATRGPENSST